jgi:hypothetical protein
MLRQDPMSRRRSVSYPGPGSRFYLPTVIWEGSLQALRRYGGYGSEGLVLWGGVIGGAGDTLVTSLLLLNHPPQGAAVRPTPEAMRAVLRSLSSRDEKLVAQVHSHPDAAFHSLGDSQRPASFHHGYISIVVPRFGQNTRSLADCAVYEYREGFVALVQREVNDRFVVQEQVVHVLPWRHAAPRRGPWNGLNRILSIIAPKRP